MKKIKLKENGFDYEAIYDKCFVDVHKEIEKPPVALGIGYHVYKLETYLNPTFTYGEMSCIIAPQKQKKSMIKTALIASYIGGNSTNYFPSMITCRKGDKYILDFDTEQGKYYAKRSFDRVSEMVEEHYENYLPFGLKSLTDSERVEFIDGVINDLSGKIGWVSIDGVADLCLNTNDIERSQEIIQKMQSWTLSGLHLNCVIHKTFDKEKGTGHLGTFVQKKSETSIFLRNTDDEPNCPVEVKQKDSRGAPFTPFHFDLDLNTVLPKECENEW